MFLDYRVWLLMYGNGVRIGIAKTISLTKNPKESNHGSRKIFRSGFSYGTATKLRVVTYFIENSPMDRKDGLSFTCGLWFRYVSNEDW